MYATWKLHHAKLISAYFNDGASIVDMCVENTALNVPNCRTGGPFWNGVLYLVSNRVIPARGVFTRPQLKGALGSPGEEDICREVAAVW